MDAARRTVELPWGPVSLLEWDPGPHSRESVVLLHGGGLDSAELSWGGLGPALADAGHHVIAPDHPGWGHSPAAGRPATQDALVAYVGTLIDALGLDSYVLGGLSLGGGLTLGHVLGGTQGVRGVMLFGSYGLMERQFIGPFAAPLHALTWATLRSGLLDRLMHVYGRSPRLLESSIANIVRNPAERTPELMAAVRAEYERGSGLVAFGQWQRDQFGRRRLRTSYLDRLGEITVPALVVHGERDTGVPAAAALDAAGRLRDGSLVLVPGAGHWVQRDRPDVVAPAVLDFLESLDGR